MSLVTVGAELLAAKERLSPYKNNITVFGSARIKSSDPLYQDAYELGKALSDGGYNIFTGGMIMTFNHQKQYEENFSDVDFKGQLKVDFYKELDHIITGPEYQQKIPADICQWVQMLSEK